jgi:hypothetical protein
MAPAQADSSLTAVRPARRSQVRDEGHGHRFILFLMLGRKGAY